MMNIQKFSCNMLAENCYIVSDESHDCVIIDCGAFYPEEQAAILSYIRTQELKPVHLVNTHGHFDHCLGNGLIYREFGLKPEIHADDEYLMEGMAQQTTDIIGARLPFDVPPVGRYFRDNDTISFGNHTFSILHTPGHTPGGCIFYCAEKRAAFSGDTLFRMSIGRTDFKGGSYKQMIDSLQNVVAKLPADTVVYTGHGPETTIGDELHYNPYLSQTR